MQLAAIQALVTYWGTGYDWRGCEAKLNALPQCVTEIDGLGIHFIHVKSRHADALPLIITHGWPGSVIEMLEVVGPLTDPTAHGGTARDAFDLVIPSLPGFGFSAAPTSLGWEPGRTARAWAALMHRLGYARYVAQGGGIGAGVTDAMAIQAPDGLAGIHLNFLRRPPLEVAAALLARSCPDSSRSMRSQTASAAAAAKAAGHPLTATMQTQIQHHALAAGFSQGFLVSAAIGLLALIIALAAIRVTRQDVSGVDPLAAPAD